MIRSKLIFEFLFILYLQNYTPEYEQELLERISQETQNKIRLEKILREELKKISEFPVESVQMSEAQERKEQEKEGQRKIDTEVMHLNEEAKRRSLGRKMLADDGAGKKQSLNTSCLNLLNNFQGIN